MAEKDIAPDTGEPEITEAHGEKDEVAAAVADAMKDVPDEWEAKEESEDATEAEEDDDSEEREATSDEKQAKAGDKQEAEQTEDAKAEADAEEKPEEDKLEPIDAPHSWKTEDKEVFTKLPRDAQEIIARRETERDKQISDMGREGAGMRQVAERWQPYFQSLNTTPEQAFDYLLRAEAALRHGTPEQKQAAINKIAADYKISLPATTPQHDNGATDEESDPIMQQYVAPIQEQLKQVTDRLNSREQSEVETATLNQVNAIQAFSEEKTDAGELAHPYFDDVFDDMVRLAAGDRAQGRTPDLKDLYERAAWSNPTTREKMMASQRTTAAASETREQRTQKVEAKKKAGASVTGSPSGRTNDRQADTVREAVTAAMEGRV